MSQNTPEERTCQAPAEHGITSETLNTILTEVGAKPVSTPLTKVIEACNQSTDSLKKQASVAESKRILENFKEKLSNYPKHLSYEGSVVLCSLIGLNQTGNINLSGLPKTDVELIYSQLPVPLTNLNGPLHFSVALDDQQDFKLKCEEFPDDKTTPSRVFNLRFFNSVIRPENLSSDIPVEQDGENVKVGSSLVFDKKRIQKLVGASVAEKPKKEEEEAPRRQTVSGRNAFELRTDILTLAVDWVKKSNNASENEVLRVAKLFYSFVENKR